MIRVIVHDIIGPIELDKKVEAIIQVSRGDQELLVIFLSWIASWPRS